MNICFFGSYDKNYSRNSILIDGLKKNDVKIIECNSQKGFFLNRYYELFRKFINRVSDIDIIFVAYRGHLDMPFAYFLGKLFSKKVVFDIFYSLHDTYIFDRKSVKRNSLKAFFYFWLDKIDCLMADKVITFTESTTSFLVNTFDLPTKKFSVVYIGGNDTLYKPIKHKNKTRVIIEFHGWFTRMQGAEYLIDAAKKLRLHSEIKFWLIGNTVNYYYPLKLLKRENLKNIHYFNSMSETNLAKKIASADIGVGHLADTKKARITFSNKMYQALACKIALIAGNFPATRELLKDSENCLLVKPENSQDLADKILFLVRNKKLRIKIAQNGYILHRTKLVNKKIGQKFKEILTSVLKNE